MSSVRVHLHRHEGCGCVVCSAVLPGPLRHYIFIAIDYVLDIVYDYVSARLVRVVFIKLFEFFAVSFKLCRRIIWIIRPCTRSSRFTSSLRPAPPRR